MDWNRSILHGARSSSRTPSAAMDLMVSGAQCPNLRARRRRSSGSLVLFARLQPASCCRNCEAAVPSSIQPRPDVCGFSRPRHPLFKPTQRLPIHFQIPLPPSGCGQASARPVARMVSCGALPSLHIGSGKPDSMLSSAPQSLPCRAGGLL